uniref:Uncharacterized protein n=1 Tax=Trieres chinensis TaxID=1514140 RepID=A0A6U1XJS9_TRICV
MAAPEIKLDVEMVGLDGVHTETQDSRSFRPSSLAGTKGMNSYRPLVISYTKADGSPGHCAIGCGHSAEDLALIFACYAALYSFLIGMFALMLRGALDTDDTHTLLWAFLVIGVLFVSFVSGAVYVGRRKLEQNLAQKRADAKRAKMTTIER